jgi:hypothetical protein
MHCCALHDRNVSHDAQVLTPAEHYLSYRAVLPHTISIPVLATWDNICAEFPVGTMEHNVEGFHTQVRLFIKVHANDEDRRELVNLIRHAPKPRMMGVGPYFYCLHDLNEQVCWLPGTDAKLSIRYLDQAFHDGMPQSWQVR